MTLVSTPIELLWLALGRQVVKPCDAALKLRLLRHELPWGACGWHLRIVRLLLETVGHCRLLASSPTTGC